MPTLDFKGKQIVYAHHLSVPYRTLDMVRKNSFLSKEGPAEDNLLIHGVAFGRKYRYRVQEKIIQGTGNGGTTCY